MQPELEDVMKNGCSFSGEAPGAFVDRLMGQTHHYLASVLEFGSTRKAISGNS